VLILASVVLVAVACGGPPNGTTRSTASSRPPELSPGSREERWTGTIDSTSYHRLYVGGTCTTDWLTRFTFTVAPDGTVTGAGAARLTSEGEPCPFPVAERQVREFTVEVAGEVRGGNMHLRLAEVSHRPSAGAEDLGGFRATVLADLKVSELLVHLDPNERAASAKVKITVAGPDRDEFASTNIVRLDRTGSG
jgi:hypothetical protein